MTAVRFPSLTGLRLSAVELVATATAATSAKGSAERRRIGRRYIRGLGCIADDDSVTLLQFTRHHFCCRPIRDSQHHMPRLGLLLCVHYINNARPLSHAFR